jgi:hypothetical protein
MFALFRPRLLAYASERYAIGTAAQYCATQYCTTALIAESINFLPLKVNSFEANSLEVVVAVREVLQVANWVCTNVKDIKARRTLLCLSRFEVIIRGPAPLRYK